MIPEWRKAHKMWSVRLGIIAALIAALQPVLPHWQDVLPDWAFAALASAVAFAGVISRLIPQRSIQEERKVRSNGNS